MQVQLCKEFSKHEQKSIFNDLWKTDGRQKSSLFFQLQQREMKRSEKKQQQMIIREKNTHLDIF